MFFFGVTVLALVFKLATDTQLVKNATEKCPEHKGSFRFCEKQWEQCLREERKAFECGESKCQCMKEIQTDSQLCKKAVDNVCLKKNGSVEIITDAKVVLYVESVLKGKIDDDYHNVDQECTSGNFHTRAASINAMIPSPSRFFSEKFSTIILLTNLTNNSNSTESCKHALKQLANRLRKLDDPSAHKSPIPYHQWHCGWENEDFGRVVMRLVAGKTSYHDAHHFNKCCARHRDCYMSQGGKTECDEDFKDCNQKVINESGKHEKEGNEVYKKYLEEKLPITGDIAYEKAPETDFHFVSYDRVAGFRDSCLQTENGRECSLLFLLLNRHFDEYHRKKLSKVYKLCENDRISTSLCASSAQECIQSQSVIDCTFQLDDCLRDVCPRAKEAEKMLYEVMKWLTYLMSIWWIELLFIVSIDRLVGKVWPYLSALIRNVFARLCNALRPRGNQEPEVEPLNGAN